MSNIHENCENYSPKKDYCLKFFEENVSEKYKVCKEYSEFSDKELSRKWSNWTLSFEVKNDNVSPAINHILDNLFLGFECFHSKHSL